MLSCNLVTQPSHFKTVGFSVIPGALLALRGDARAASLLLAIMAGKRKPASGEVIFEDSPIRQNTDYSELMQYIPPSALPRLWETVERAVARLAKAGQGAEELVEAALRYWGLDAQRKQRCGSLPKSLQRRVILTQLLTLPRPIWLLDQPEYELDDDGLKLLDTLVANRCNQDGIVLIATSREAFMNHLPTLDLKDFLP